MVDDDNNDDDDNDNDERRSMGILRGAIDKFAEFSSH